MDLLAPSDGGYNAGGAGFAGGNDGGDVFTYVGGLTDLVRSAEKAFGISYKKEVPYELRADGEADKQHSLILLAKDQSTYDVWSDGINFLLVGQTAETPIELTKAFLETNAKTKSKTFDKELDDLVNIDVRMSLLNPSDTSNFDSLPTIPPPPPNYNFANFKICQERRKVIPAK
jgi:hypothetical protein